MFLVFSFGCRPMIAKESWRRWRKCVAVVKWATLSSWSSKIGASRSLWTRCALFSPFWRPHIVSWRSAGTLHSSRWTVSTPSPKDWNSCTVVAPISRRSRNLISIPWIIYWVTSRLKSRGSDQAQAFLLLPGLSQKRNRGKISATFPGEKRPSARWRWFSRCIISSPRRFTLWTRLTRPSTSATRRWLRFSSR